MVAACGGDDEGSTSGTAAGGQQVASSSASGTGTGGGGTGGSTASAGGGEATGGGSASTGTGGGNGEGASSAGGGVPDCETEPLGATPVEDVAWEDCVPVGGTPVPVGGEADGTLDYYAQLLTVGERRAAGGPDTSAGPLLFDSDGANPVLGTAVEGTTIASRDDQLGVLGPGPSLLRFDEAGAPIGDATVVAEASGEQTIGADASGWLVAWEAEGQLLAQPIDDGGSLDGDAHVVVPELDDDRVTLAASNGGATTALAFSAGDAIGVATWSAGELAGSLPLIVCSPQPLAVVAVAPRGDGWIVLARLGDADEAVGLLLALDASGQLAADPRRLEGLANASGLAVNGDTVMVTGNDPDDRGVARAFDAESLEPAGPPVCLTAERTFFPVAVDADGEGFAFLYGDDETFQLLLSRTDASGRGI
jgi:hypothetical protein